MEVIQTLILCEKPDAAAHLAQALDEDNQPLRTEVYGVPFYKATRGKNTLVVCSAIGHLYAVDSKGRSTRRNYPSWVCDWKPRHLIDKKALRLARWLSVIKSLAASADRCINACDYDTEGSLIGYTILRYACGHADQKALRMKFSTMTEKDLNSAYGRLIPTLDLSQVEAGRCRHEIDWVYGVNLSRVLTESALKAGNGYATLSTGRVQGPTLKFIVDREEEIQSFVPSPFWNIDARIRHGGQTYVIEYEKNTIPTKAGAQLIVEECQDALLAVEKTDSYQTSSTPPHPFNLSTLQSEAYHHFGLTPARTLALAEKLYLNGLISYPRTSSQDVPPDIGYRDILKKISADPNYRLLATKLANQPLLRPNQGPKTDPAHPAIYPTGVGTRTALQQESKLLDLIIRRFMATFAESSLQENTTTTLKKHPHRFFLNGTKQIREGWIEYYRPYASYDDRQIPLLAIGDKVPIDSIAARERFTEPPHRYNRSSILLKMENTGIGTKATRAETIETLYQRDYIEGNQIRPTTLALRITSILSQECPDILDAEFTADLEGQMDKIRTGEATRIEVLTDAIEHLRPVMRELASKSDVFGPEISEVVKNQRASRATFDSPCPTCKSKLTIIRSKATGKRFVGCSGYDKGCRFSLPLPQYGTLTIMNKNCKTCGFQLVRSWTPRRRTVISCPRCYLDQKPTANPTRPAQSSYLKLRRLSSNRRKARTAKNIKTMREATNASAIGS